jgi:hypothetical protein
MIELASKYPAACGGVLYSKKDNLTDKETAILREFVKKL